MSQNIEQLTRMIARLTSPGTWVNIAAWRVSVTHDGLLRIQKPIGMHGWQDVESPDPSIEQALLQHLPTPGSLLSPLSEQPPQASQPAPVVRIERA